MWTLGSVRIFPDKLSDSFIQTIARLQPLASGTLYHIFGYEYDIKKLSAKVVSYADRNDLIAMTRSESTYTLSGAGIDWGNYLVKSVQSDMMSSIWQNIRPDLACDSPVFAVDIELYKDED